MQTLFALIDCNHFYVSCERAFRPELEGKPVAVLSNNDGCIVALSPELKALGIKRGTPWFRIQHLIKKHDIRIFSSNYTLYGDMSFRVMAILDSFSPEVEVYSIDEAFLILSGFIETDIIEYGKIIRKTILKATGIPVSIGFASTKTLAKLANRIAKKSIDSNGVFQINDEEVRQKVLQKTDVEHIWGIGYRYAVKLKKYGIMNARQLTEMDDGWILNNMTIVGLRMVKELRGIPYSEDEASPARPAKNRVKEKRASYIKRETDHWDSLYLPNAHQAKKSIVSSRSFGKPVRNYQELSEALCSYCNTALLKLRQQGSLAKRITVFLTTNPFKDEPQYANYREAILPCHTAYPPDFAKAAGEILKTIFKNGYSYKKVGVMITDIIQEEYCPQDLFQTAYPDDNRSKIMKCVDGINSRWGQGTISFAGEGVSKKWGMRRELLSPRYTTSWKELLVVKA